MPYYIHYIRIALVVCYILIAIIDVNTYFVYYLLEGSLLKMDISNIFSDISSSVLNDGSVQSGSTPPNNGGGGASQNFLPITNTDNDDHSIDNSNIDPRLLVMDKGNPADILDKLRNAIDKGSSLKKTLNKDELDYLRELYNAHFPNASITKQFNNNPNHMKVSSDMIRCLHFIIREIHK